MLTGIILPYLARDYWILDLIAWVPDWLEGQAQTRRRGCSWRPVSTGAGACNSNAICVPIARISHTCWRSALPTRLTPKPSHDFVAGARANPDKFNAAGAAGVPEFALDAFLKGATSRSPTCRIATSPRRRDCPRTASIPCSSFAAVRPLSEANKVRVVALGGRSGAGYVAGVGSGSRTRRMKARARQFFRGSPRGGACIAWTRSGS